MLLLQNSKIKHWGYAKIQYKSDAQSRTPLLCRETDNLYSMRFYILSSLYRNYRFVSKGIFSTGNPQNLLETGSHDKETLGS